MNFSKRAALQRQYDTLKKDHDILLAEATKAAKILKQQNTLLDKYRALVEVKDQTIAALKKEIDLLHEKEGCCCGNCKDESAVRDGDNTGRGLCDVAVHRNEEAAHAEEPVDGGAEES